MKVLIVTEPDDVHAVLVQLGLEKKGVDCELFFSADMPTKQRNNIFISERDCSWSSLDSEEHRYDKPCDAIWWRRPRQPFLPDILHTDDKPFVRKEMSAYHSSIPYLLDNNAWWVNPIASHQKTRSKIVQLKLAYQCGFKMPETLISNSSEAIKSFIKENIPQKVIYKPFFPQFWAENDGIKMLYTDKISLEDLPSDEMLEVVPGIYQHYVEKQYELRVTCFGSHISAVKIDSQNHHLGQTDWRKIPGAELSLSERELPHSIKNKIIVFMKKMGMVFGCFDFIVTPEEEIIFLEVNEQGQFLWVEELLPELCYLDMFCEFLIRKSFNFSWEKTHKTIRAGDLDEKALEIVNSNLGKHVYLNQIKKVA